MIDDLPEMIGWMKGEGFLFCVVFDFALRQCLLQFFNLSLGEVGVAKEKQRLQLRELLQALHIGQLIANEIQTL